MRPGRELDTEVATKVFGHKVWAQNKTLFENAEKGDRPLRSYSKEMEWAWEVAKAMKVTLIPVEGGNWFAFVGPENNQGWESPQAVLKFFESGQFDDCGAAVGTEAAQVICEAAVKAADKRRGERAKPSLDELPQLQEELQKLQDILQNADVQLPSDQTH